MRKEHFIRRAKPVLDDARALLAVERKSLGDSPYSPYQIISVLARPEHYAYLAFAADEAVGFCSCMQTPLGRGGQLEIDMLGVVAGQRRRGIGTSLISRAVEEAIMGRAVCGFRTVVAADNLASRHAFQGIGFAPECTADMMVYEVHGRSPVPSLPSGWAWRTLFTGALEDSALSETFEGTGPRREVHYLQDRSGNLVAAAECLQVQTLAYVGLWVEKFEALEGAAGRMARALAERAKGLNVDEVGYLLPRQETDEIYVSLVAAGYENVGKYLVLRGDAATLAS
ncbi:MAG: N-acetyltransferase family protein [Anaerolineales bacterium]